MYSISAVVLISISVLGIVWIGARRARHYRLLRRVHEAVPPLNGSINAAIGTEQAIPSFENRIVRLDDVLSAHCFELVRSAVERLTGSERSLVPIHKKGGTFAYETLCREAPDVVGLYLSQQLRTLVSRVVGRDVLQTPLHDQSSCSVLSYERPGDHIGWHYDHNFYKGRHFTVLVPIINAGRGADGLSSAQLVAKVAGHDYVVPTPPNSLILFEGAKVLHKVTPVAEGERRVILSMTFSESPKNTILQGVARRIKDMAFFGIRSLWT